jgi:D-galactarolactone cycloisomerase
MKIVKVSAIPMSAPVSEEKRHRTDLGTKVKSDATLIRVETDNGLTGIGAALGISAGASGGVIKARIRFLRRKVV